MMKQTGAEKIKQTEGHTNSKETTMIDPLTQDWAADTGAQTRVIGLWELPTAPGKELP